MDHASPVGDSSQVSESRQWKKSCQLEDTDSKGIFSIEGLAWLLHVCSCSPFNHSITQSLGDTIMSEAQLNRIEQYAKQYAKLGMYDVAAYQLKLAGYTLEMALWKLLRVDIRK